MNIGPFFYRMLGVPKQGQGAGRFLGTAFPIAPGGGLITCRHVVEACTADESLATYDNEKHNLVLINTEEIIVPSSPDYLDLAFVPNALKRDKAEFFPLLEPASITIGENVYSFGYFRSEGSDLAGAVAGTGEHGYFKGNIVNFSRSRVTPGSTALSLSYPIVEGLSGSPVLTYHNGPKVVGMCYGNVQSRVTARETIEYKDQETEYKETVARIVEFGRAHHAAGIVKFLTEACIEGFVVSTQHVNVAGLA